LTNQGHAGEDRGPQIDGCESEYEHCSALGTRGDPYFVLEERMLLIGPDVDIADRGRGTPRRCIKVPQVCRGRAR
jgi:hypothetical protein